MNMQPVQKRTPLASSELVKVFDIPGSNLFHVEAVTPDGTTKIFDNVRAYAKRLDVAEDGKITIQIAAKTTQVAAVRVMYPYNYLCADKTLCVLRLNSMRTKSDENHKTFGLNYDLFCLPWETCIVLHGDSDGLDQLYVTSRYDWDRGELNVHNQEVQMFIPVGKDACLKPSMARGFLRGEIVEWISRCILESGKKRRV